ncbi:MAG TPA: c-type cytochrome, partial [Pirellulales bacterium]|nr:c-type cytochrome [Pirellulales bacterium]
MKSPTSFLGCSARTSASWLLGLLFCGAMLCGAHCRPAHAAAPAAPASPIAGPDHSLVPAYERFTAEGKLDAVSGGLLLLGELNCTSCHAADKKASAAIERKQAPVLNDVGARVRLNWLRKFLDDPQHTKPGTTMPSILAGMPAGERKKTIEELAHFLASTGSVLDRAPDRKQAHEGQKLFHQVGCVACHGARDGKTPALPDSVPLGDLVAKYTVPGLITFLADPLKSRPAGRMPSLNLNQDELRLLAGYLMQDAVVLAADTTLKYEYYAGDWQKLPDFSQLKPAAQGKASGFDCTVAPQPNSMALRFTGFLRINAPGDYVFSTFSDDGSKLWIDGKLAVDNDGVHAPREMSGEPIHLERGIHGLVAGVFNAGGGVELDVEIAGGGADRQSVLPLLTLTPEKPPQPGVGEDSAFAFDNDLAAKGRDAFVRVGCASCHEMTRAKRQDDELLAPPPLAKLRAGRGCLAAQVPAGAP